MDEIYEIVKALNRLKDHVGELTRQIAFLAKSPSQKLNSKWLESESVCRILRVSDRTLLKMRNEGVLPFTRVRRRILYRASDVQDWLEGRISGSGSGSGSNSELRN